MRFLVRWCTDANHQETTNKPTTTTCGCEHWYTTTVFMNTHWKQIREESHIKLQRNAKEKTGAVFRAITDPSRRHKPALSGGGKGKQEGRVRHPQTSSHTSKMIQNYRTRKRHSARVSCHLIPLGRKDS